MTQPPASGPPLSSLPPGTQPPGRTPDDADLALARVATPWLGLYGRPGDATEVTRLDFKLAQALTAWLAARGIY